jgi:Zn-dependent metalloprotease
MYYHRNPRECVVPPHMLKEIVKRGGPKHREWAMNTLMESAKLRGHREILGEMLTVAIPAGEKRRTIYDAKSGTALPGKLVRGEGDPVSKDAEINEAYDGAGVTYDLYHDIFKRNSVDNRGLRLDSTVHYSKKYDNAFWNGQQMVYGDGDGELFNRFTVAIDVIGHELTHGVTQYEAGLIYQDQSGALNESISDVFGSLVKQYSLKQTADQADWLIGEGLLAKGVKGVALRSMKAPGTAYDDPILGKDPQPASMKDYNTTTQDNGGVHINSGIPNHAFFVVATELGSYAWQKAGQIWYAALHAFPTNTDFQQAADITFQVSGGMFGAGSIEQKAVQKGWAAVDISIP